MLVIDVKIVFNAVMVSWWAGGVTDLPWLQSDARLAAVLHQTSAVTLTGGREGREVWGK